ncbi:MAG: DUF418 domain-containing protein [Bacteroidota bacterium]
MRLTQIDALRGFALFGILMVNIFVFHAPYAHYGPFYFSMAPEEVEIVEGVVFFFANNFMFLYAFLFGYSFWLQYERWQQAQPFRPYWTRRMLVLAGIGVAHILLLSFGDILLPYALLGLTLPWWVRQKRSVIIIGLVLINLAPVYEFVLRGFVEYPSIFFPQRISVEEYTAIHHDGSFWDLLVLRLEDYWSFGNEKLIMYIPKEMSLFLLGLLAAQERLAERVRPWLGIGFAVVGLTIAYLITTYRSDILGFFDYENSVLQRSALGLVIHTGGLLHGLSYVLLFFGLWQWSPVQRALHWLTYPGRLSLTNYLMQSLICLVLFAGFDLYAQLLPSTLVLIVCAIYSAQTVFSYWWLRRFRQGPMEGLWRRWAGR